MAHSSGGGSCGGGCHSGSSSSGRNSHSSSHTYHRYAHYQYAGSRRYSYIDKNGEKQFIYCNLDPTDQKPAPWIIGVILLLFMFSLFREAGNMFFIPQKIDNPYSEILIEDRMNVIEDEAQLRQDLLLFYEETGVTPAVLTIPGNACDDGYNSLMDFAMGKYYHLFQDEKHWLVVYSALTDASGKVLPDTWSFEGIIGDDTDRSINDWMCKKFTKKTYRNLTYMSDPGKAIGNSFNSLLFSRKFGFLSYNAVNIVVLISIFLTFSSPILYAIITAIERRKYKNAVLDE